MRIAQRLCVWILYYYPALRWLTLRSSLSVNGFDGRESVDCLLSLSTAAPLHAPKDGLSVRRRHNAHDAVVFAESMDLDGGNAQIRCLSHQI